MTPDSAGVGYALLTETDPATSPSRRPMHGAAVQCALAGLLAVGAFDPERWVRGWIFALGQDLVALVAVGLVAWSLASHEATQWRPSAPAIGAAPLLLVAWVVWAAVGPGSLAVAVRFGVILAAVVFVALESAIALARSVALGFVVHVGAAATVAWTTSVEARVDGRLTLVSLEANELARVAAIGAVAGTFLFLRGTWPDRTLGFATAALGAATVALTGSRTGALALIVGTLVVLVLLASRALLLVLAAGGLALAGLAYTSVGGSDLPALTALDRGTEGIDNFNGRQSLWLRLFDATEEVRIAGVGVANDRDFIKERVPTGWNAQHAHNLVLHLLVTTGVVGAGLMLSGLVWALLTAAARPRGDTKAAFALSMLAIVLVESVTESVVRTPAFGWAAVAGAAALTAGVGVSQTPAEP